MARQLARRHQRERIAGIVVVCLGLAVLAVSIVALRQPNGHVSAASGNSSNVGRQSSASTASTSASASGTSSVSSSTSATDLKAVPLVVLNNSTISGLAEQAAHDFEAGGWTVSHYGNLQNVIVSTCAYYDPSVAHAKAAAQALQRQFPTIKRVKPRFAELPSGPVVVVLTSDYSST